MTTSTPLNRFVAALAMAAAACFGTATAQVSAGAPAVSLYEELGASAGVAALAADLTRCLAADPVSASFFKGVDLARFESRLASQLCEVSGGGCRYEGKDMKTVHSGIDITKADFNAVVEMLQRSMDTQRIAFAVQNRLLARLAPMHREIVNAPSSGAAAAAPTERRATQ